MYRSTVKNIWSSQVAQGANNLAWDLVHGSRIRELMSMVDARVPRIKRARYAEKIDGSFSPFQSLGQVPVIEEWMWNKGKGNRRSALTWL
jgi:hypothetical protein